MTHKRAGHVNGVLDACNDGVCRFVLEESVRPRLGRRLLAALTGAAEEDIAKGIVAVLTMAADGRRTIIDVWIGERFVSRTFTELAVRSAAERAIAKVSDAL